MRRYNPELIKEVKRLRTLGKTYSEIKENLHIVIAKSTLSDWCKNVILPQEYLTKVTELNRINMHRGRSLAMVANQIKRKKMLEKMVETNIPIAKTIENINTAKVALAMLFLGEGTKSKGGAATLSLGNTDPRIIKLFLILLKKCYHFSTDKIRCTVQCRADQDIQLLEQYWQRVTGIPKRLFYKTRIDPRTIGKPTKRPDYKGVLRVDYFDTKLWIELETLADLIYNTVIDKGPEV